MESRIELIHAERFILGGKAIVIFWNEETNNSFRFKITYSKKWMRHFVELEFQSIAPMNPEIKPTIGSIGHSQDFFTKLQPTDYYFKAMQSFAWVWLRIRELNLNPKIHIMHTGICSVCGRELKDQESIRLGIGPICGGRTKH